MTTRTKEATEEIKDHIRQIYMAENNEGVIKSWWATYHYHIKVGIFGLNNLEITVILIP